MVYGYMSGLEPDWPGFGSRSAEIPRPLGSAMEIAWDPNIRAYDLDTKLPFTT